MSPPILDQINIVCGDVDASLAFYRKLGVDIPETNVWRTETGPHHVNAAEHPAGAVRLELDSTTFAQIWNGGWKDHSNLKGRVVVGFRVPARADVDTVFHNMTGAGYRCLHAPDDGFWGARYAILEDPDGIAVCVMSPISLDKKAPPPDV